MNFFSGHRTAASAVSAAFFTIVVTLSASITTGCSVFNKELFPPVVECLKQPISPELGSKVLEILLSDGSDKLSDKAFKSIWALAESYGGPAVSCAVAEVVNKLRNAVAAEKDPADASVVDAAADRGDEFLKRAKVKVQP